MDSREGLARIINSRNVLLDRKAHKKETKIDRILYGTLLDSECRSALTTQKRHREHFKPIPRRIVSNKKHTKEKTDRKTNSQTGRIYKYKEEILSILQENSVVIIKGGTGTGKTTQIPQMLMEILSEKTIIGCTQPRRAATISVAEHMENEIAKEDVGYSVRFSTKKGRKIKYMTEGVLVREIIRDRRLTRYSVIVLDEIHEGTVESLILVKYLLLLVKKRTDLKVVLMSATLEESALREIGPFPVVEIEHTKYPIAIKYLSKPVTDYIVSVCDKVVEVSASCENILVFLTGIEDIQIIYHILNEKIPKYRIFPLHSKMRVSDQMAAINSPGPKCILSTNISETSLTITEVKYVVDCGMHKRMVYDPIRNVRMMKIAPIQKMQAVQRAGRTGRTSEGTCFRMYTEEEFKSLRTEEPSKLELEEMEYYIFMLIQLNLPIPSHENIKAAISRMNRHRVIDKFKLTSLGDTVLKLPLSVTHSIFLLEGQKNNCGWEVAAILAMIEATNNMQAIKPEEYAEYKEMHELSSSDHLLLLYLYKKSKIQSSQKNRHKDKAERIISQLCAILNIPNKSTFLGHPHEYILEALAVSHRHNICIRTTEKAYKEIHTGVECTLPQNTLATQTDQPSYVIYNEIIEIQKTVMSIVTAVPHEKIQSIKTK